jgi:hypothetical protein
MLTATQRLFFDLNGFVLLKGVFTEAECDEIVTVADRMVADSPYPRYDSESQRVLFGPAWYSRRLLNVAMDPRLRGPGEALVGGECRLEENEFLITAGATEVDDPAADRFRWHRGLSADYGSFQVGDRYHCLFTKALLYLTRRGRMTGTWVVPGSHRLSAPVRDLEPLIDPTLTAYVDAERGDVLFFGETLVHASPPRPSPERRVLLVVAFSAPFMASWSRDSDPPATLPYETTPEERRFIYGEGRYAFRVDR